MRYTKRFMTHRRIPRPMTHFARLPHKSSRLKALALLGLAATAAYAAPLATTMSEAKASGALGFFIKDEVTANECGECHVAYDAGLMPQGAWVKVMNDLPDHFGEDASLPDPTRQHILDYLVSHAPRGDGPNRITEQPWFTGSHPRFVVTVVSWFRSEPAPSLAKCDGCHAIAGLSR